MEWLSAMNRAIDHLEANMTQKLDIEEVAKLAFSSPFHFQRMYHMLTGVTVAEYVRRRRLTLAAQEIMSEVKVIDVALKYGYETPEAFSKAFRKMHGMSPSTAREPGTNLKAFPKLSFHISIKGDKDMDYKLIEKDSFKVIGKTKRITTHDGENLKLIPLFWDECMADGSYQRICSMAGAMGVFGICMDFEPNYEAFTYMIGVEDNGETPGDFSPAEIPAARWAVFESIGPMPGAIQKVWERIYAEWIPATGYQQEEGPQLEVYPVGDVPAPDYKCEVWIPIKK
ncbi:AraC family transcriptional regulator [Desulfosporosinus fructosivorans]|uniref:AraC family transcriptional regulator n=1 Tax=Desulfosporosinus fructosivorans TaxID=2018669 RepID=A0A4Z0R9Z4_9FIRM|nr:AraC family transcriptional regulator [Desulfosporosinus fructosivorans]TGE39195.1 AraC family transcriptional regulator [Desulfosporosinus fructosivorans]